MSNFKSMDILVKIYRVESEIQRAKATGNYAKALSLYDQLIEMKKVLPNRLGVAKSIAEKAFLLENCEFYQDALNTYLMAAQISFDSPHKKFKEMINERIQRLS